MIVVAIAGVGALLSGTIVWRLRHARGLGPTERTDIASSSGPVNGGQSASLSESLFSGDAPGSYPSVSVVVPALNEEESVDWVIDNIPSWVSEVVLVDGLSVDGTELVVTDRRDDVVIVHQRSRGKGAALRAGFAAATGEIVVMIDADGSTDPREMGRFVDALVGGADFVKGSRNLTGGGSVDFTVLRHLGNLGFVYAANILFGVRFTDLCYGYCAFWRKDLERLALTADGFEIEMELILSAVKAGLSISEVPSMEL
jgi:glycosyltransferase involved in cell wall biosynthesis